MNTHSLESSKFKLGRSPSSAYRGEMAKDPDRARSLRRFVDEIAATKAAPGELVRNLELMALMADWLDPLVNAAWPEVDGVAERNPYGSLW